MISTIEAATSTLSQEVEFATFYVDELLLGVDILQVEEINRHLTMTPVPHAPVCVEGVINLRGNVVTVVNLRTILGLPPGEITKGTRNVVVHAHGEQTALLVDRVADVLRTRRDAIDAPPANVNGVDSRFFKGVVRLEKSLLVILDVDEALKVHGGA